MQHILIVEDDLDIQDLLRNFLQEVGYEITIASDGMEAIALFSSARFDLRITLNPKRDGLLHFGEKNIKTLRNVVLHMD